MKGAANVFLYRFQQFMNLHRGSSDMLRWMTRFFLADPNNAEVSAYLLGLSTQDQATTTREEAMEALNQRFKATHSAAIPIPEGLNALMFVSLSDLTQDQRQVLTSLMAHRIRALGDYRVAELREVYLEVFCTTRTSVDNPLLAPSPQGGRKTFLVLDEGFIDDSQGIWVEDEDEGVEGFLELDEDCLWVYDNESAAWFQRRFQGRRMKRGPFKGRKKGKGKGKGRGGRRFLKHG